jgi:uncharacterized RDD family membrane protein YckC
MSEPVRRLESVHTIRTPEYVEFEYPLAGLMSRFLAWLIDVLVSTTAAGALTLVVVLAGLLVPGVATAVVLVLWFVANWGYFMGAEYLFAGRTIGKRALGLRTIQQSGARIGFYQAAIRNIVRAVDNLPILYLVGGTIAALSPKGHRLGDMAAGTVVVRERSRKLPSSIARPAEAMTLLGSDKRIEERVRRATVEEREVLLSAALRREELSMEARLKLFRELAAYVSERFGIERPEHVSEEKLVVAVAGLLVLEAPAKKGRGAPASGPLPTIPAGG